MNDLITQLKLFTEKNFPITEVDNYLNKYQLKQEHLMKYSHFSKEQYTRNLVYRDLDFEISWFDSRKSFSSAVSSKRMPDYIEKPDNEINNLDEGSYVLILTHDHELDYLLMKKQFFQSL